MKYNTSSNDKIKLKNKFSVVEILESRGYKVHKNRTNPCPFCGKGKKKNPPFSIFIGSEGYELYKCHRCGAAGDVTALMKHFGMRDSSEIHLPKKVTPRKAKAKQLKDTEKKKRVATYIYNSSIHLSMAELKKFNQKKGFVSDFLAKANEIMLACGAKKNSYEEDIKEFGTGEILVFPIRDADGKLVAVQKIGAENHSGCKNKKIYGEVKGVFATPMQEGNSVIVVESVLNAVALSCIGYNACAVLSTSNTKNLSIVKEIYSGKKIYLWLDADTNDLSVEAGEKFDVTPILWGEMRKKDYDIRDLMIDSSENFADVVEDYIRKASFAKMQSKLEDTGLLKAIEPEIENPTALEELELLVDDIRKNEIILFSAETGVGKTYSIAKKAVEKAKRGELVTIFTSTKDIVDKIVGLCRQFLGNNEHISISRNVSDGSNDSERMSGSNSVGHIAVTTYYYLGFKGHTNLIYGIAKELTEGRVIFCDEIQALIQLCTVNISLAARYKKYKNTYNQISKCIRDCEKCFLGYLRKSPNKYYYQEFYKSFDVGALEKHTKKVLPRGLPADIFDIATYDDDDGMFNRLLDTQPKYTLPEYSFDFMRDELDKEDDIIFSNYTDSVLEYLLHANLSMVTPELDEEYIRISEITEENHKQVNYPAYACLIPHLKGFNILPILQLMDGKSIIMCSATIPPDTENLLTKIIENKPEWKLNKKQVTEIPVTFNATFMVTEKSLSIYKQIELAKKIKTNTLFLCAKKSEAQEVYNWSKAANKDIELFLGGDFIDSELSRKRATREMLMKSLTISYPRSSQMTGIDYADKTLLILDCNSFYPQIICTEKDREKRKEEIRKKLQALIIQVIGRLLRTNLERKYGEIIKDDRPIIFLLHGLSCDIDVNKNLFHNLEIVRDRFFTQQNTVANILSSFEEVLCGDPISDYVEMERQENLSKVTKKDTSVLSKKQREMLSGEIDKAKLDKKKSFIDKKVNLAQRMIEEGKSYKEIKDKLTLSKYPELREKIKQIIAK